MTQAQTIGILPLGRATFDVAFAEEKLRSMLTVLERIGKPILGTDRLLMDTDTTEAAIEALYQASPSLILVLQVTFTDAATIARISDRFQQPIAIWAVPEPRLGGRLRLNAFCGLNLASHALGLRQRAFSWLYTDPEADGVAGDLDALLSGGSEVRPVAGNRVPVDPAVGGRTAPHLDGLKIGRIGHHPDGFDTCQYDRAELKSLTGIDVEELQLDALFDEAGRASLQEVDPVRTLAQEQLNGLDAVDPDQLERSYRLKVALDHLREQGGYDAFAVRCWPETFTQYGGAVCGPVSMMGEAKVPCACEADVYGAATQLLLQAVADRPVFLVDLVDLDPQDDTGVVWHCGQAPVSMADPAAPVEAAVHSNRRMPLLYQFALKPGQVTFARISQAYGDPKLVIARAEILQRPMAFTGTSGVVRFQRPAGEMMERVMNAGLEHHMALTYGDHRDALLSSAAALGLPVLEL